MASLTVSNLDDDLKHKLRVRAAKNGRSMAEEVRCILADAVGQDTEEYGLGTAIRKLFAPYGDVVLEIPPRDDLVRETSVLDE